MPHIIFLRVDSLAYAESAGPQGDELDMRQKQTGSTDPREPLSPLHPIKQLPKMPGQSGTEYHIQCFNIEWLSLKSLVWPGQLLVFALLVTLAG